MTSVCWCIDDERLYGFIRVDTGDELSKRVKFVLVTWVGVNVGALKRAKMSIDKAVVKTAIPVPITSINLEICTRGCSLSGTGGGAVIFFNQCFSPNRIPSCQENILIKLGE